MPEYEDQPGRPDLSDELLSVLVCPACHEPVVRRDDALACEGCGRSYPIRDGVPIMLIDEAPPPAGAEGG